MLLAACGGEYAPRTGDLLFQLTAAEGMTDAIVAATERGGAVTFSHVGIVEATAGGELPAYWAEHFAALGMPVPEGVAGTNPNDMAHDPAVEIVWRYYDE